ncbi:hypothetical protein HS088_TW14G00619 [Tripterygium wilfordii]|uniref:Wax synthase domain-containing protein n=1 Tax=Tripterygium wilfordii TaxID=458696 RepID=A0A7J7CRH2_TRIWF|nr:acyl-CoA--sterol O-acyltransferase 1-like [Tripterygium wilfordii]KAF5736476.1 hypothetical protein HS088_TW14G00619 [Tripterygium wilfordii]
MEWTEFYKFVRVWLTAIASLAFCFKMSNTVPPGPKRLILVVLPIVGLFLYLPLTISSPHLGGTTGFFLAWLANFKLLLWAFNQGPLASGSSISLPLFVALACLPIKIQQTPNSKPKEEALFPVLGYGVKALIIILFVRIYDYSDYLHPKILLLFYAFHIYFLLEIILVVGATLARTLMGLELEPQFNQPVLATSLQDFWGKRWNLMVTGILRPTVYVPTVKTCSRLIGRKWAPLPGVFMTFVVSGVMHELIFYYLGRVRPTWEVGGFFILHGICLTIEIVLKMTLDERWRLSRVISGPLTTGFVMATGIWLFLPAFGKSKIDVRAFEEYAAIGALLRSMTNVSPSTVTQ